MHDTFMDQGERGIDEIQEKVSDFVTLGETLEGSRANGEV
jgi:hypothetical protein